MTESCELCTSTGGDLVWSDERCRVIRIDDPDYAGFCRVVWNEHVKEMSDLAPAERSHLMNVVLAVETTLRALMRPTKINLASLGNVVPHLHWHVIPRFEDDRHFPRPIWGEPRREGAQREIPTLAALRAGMEQALGGYDRAHQV